MSDAKIRVLIADDSAIIRGLLEKAFGNEADFEIADSVSNGRKAVDSAKEKHPDLVITDIDMPELDGVEATRILAGELVLPVVVFSEDITAKGRALQAGAILFEPKPALSAFKMEKLKGLVARVREAYTKSRPRGKARQASFDSSDQAFSSFKIVCLGASTGGPTAVQSVLGALGKGFPLPILYAQHVDVGADRKMVDWFNESCPGVRVWLAESGQEALPGNVYMAPADSHLVIDYVNAAGNPVLRLSSEPPERFLRPAVNKLFRSAARHYRNACLAVLMTGMGRDGAEGCKMVLDNGGYTIAEDKSTCAVFGMPAAAIELGAASEILPRPQIAPRLLELAK